MVYEYVTATVDVAQQKLRIAINEVTLVEYEYRSR